MKKCSMCGVCCYFFDENNKKRKCKYLIKVANKCLCRIYNNPNRVGKVIYKHEDYVVKCFLRSDSPYDYPNCPWNCGKPIMGKEEKNDKTKD